MNLAISAAEARPHDRRRLVTTMVLAVAASAALVAVMTANGASLLAALIVAAPIPVMAWLGTIYAFTEVDATGLRSRRWVATWQVTWPEVQSISTETTPKPKGNGENRRVVVTATLHRFWYLGAPDQSGAFDPSFAAQAARIRTDWLDVTAAKKGRPTPYRLTRPGRTLFQVLGTIATLAAAIVLVASTSGMRPSWDAHFGRGTQGTFTVTSVSCGKGCTYYGDFVSPSGPATRTNVKLSDSPSSMQIGEQVAVIDSGGSDNVFPAGGGVSWVLTCVAQGLAAAVLALGVSKLANDRVRRRWEARTAAAAGADGSAR